MLRARTSWPGPACRCTWWSGGRSRAAPAAPARATCWSRTRRPVPSSTSRSTPGRCGPTTWPSTGGSGSSRPRAAWSSSSPTRSRTTRRTSPSRPAAASSPASFPLDDDSDPDAARTRRRSPTCPPARGYSRRGDGAGRLGPVRAPPATTAARSRTSTSAPARPSPARSPTASAARSWSSRTPRPTTRRTSRFTAGGGLSPASFSLDDDADGDAARTRGPSPTCRPGSGYSVAETVPAGWDQTRATCSDGSPVSNIDVGAGRDRHLHVRQPQARPDRGRQGRHARRPAGLLLHRRRRPVARELLSSTTTPNATLSNTRTFSNVRARIAATRWPRRCRAAGTRRRATCNDGSPVSNIDVSAGETVTCTFSNRKRGQIVAVKDAVPERPAGLRVHGRRRPVAGELLRSTTTPTRTLSNTQTFANVVPGSGYSLAETVPTGWDQTSRHLQRRQPGRRTSTSRPGETVTCTLVNTEARRR